MILCAVRSGTTSHPSVHELRACAAHRDAGGARCCTAGDEKRVHFAIPNGQLQPEELALVCTTHLKRVNSRRTSYAFEPDNGMTWSMYPTAPVSPSEDGGACTVRGSVARVECAGER